jgi:hypothetical protein
MRVVMDPTEAAVLLQKLHSCKFMKDCAEAPSYRSVWDRLPELVEAPSREDLLDTLSGIAEDLRRTNEDPVADRYTTMISYLSSLWGIGHVGDMPGATADNGVPSSSSGAIERAEY